MAVTVYLYVPGRAGELIFSLGLIPALLKRYDEVRLFTLRDYVNLPLDFEPAVAALKAGTLSVHPIPLEMPEDAPHNVRVVGAFGSFPKNRVGESISHLYAYSTHSWYPDVERVTQGSFVRAFCEACDIPFEQYVWPQFVSPEEPEEEPYHFVLAMPTTHTGSSVMGRLAVPDHVWASIATAARAKGLVPFTTGHLEAGQYGLPGWTNLDGPVELATGAVQRAHLVIAGNSGLAFTGLLADKVRVLCLDDTDYPHSFAKHPEDLPPAMEKRFTVIPIAKIVDRAARELIACLE